MPPRDDEVPGGSSWVEWMRALGRRARHVREFLGLTQDELGRMAGVSQGAISRLESGRGLATPLLVVVKIGGALQQALATVDQSMLSAEARRMIEEGLPADAPGSIGSSAGLSPDQRSGPGGIRPALPPGSRQASRHVPRRRACHREGRPHGRLRPDWHPLGRSKSRLTGRRATRGPVESAMDAGPPGGTRCV